VTERFLNTVRCVAAVWLAGAASAGAQDFVRRDGTHLLLGRQRFYYLGTGCYYLAYYAQDTSPGPAGKTWRQMADEILDRSHDMGLRTIRIWAFNENDDAWALQTAPGVYREAAWVGFDYVLDRARRLNLRLVMPLVNNWPDYGGMNWYVKHSPTADQALVGDAFHDQFYTNAPCRQAYRNHAAAMIQRTNTINGLVYRDDPTILSWQLANEPRCATDPTGLTVRDWVYEMAAYVKSLDTNHMVSTGEEGWTDSQNWEGTRWLLNSACPDVDYAVIHCWPDWWPHLWGTTEPTLFHGAMAWVRDHLADAGRVLNKPLVLSEYGKTRPLDGDYGRDFYYRGWFDEVFASASTNGPGAGLHFWMFEADNSGHDDGFSVFFGDTSTVQLVRDQAARMNRLIAPRILGIRREAGGVKLAWTEVVGRPGYRVLASDDLHAWRSLGVTAASEWTDATTDPSAMRFYAIRPEY
jgi:mannan endo-1,4-beta-mannosidase